MTKEERDKRWSRVIVEHVPRLHGHQKPSRVRRHERRRNGDSAHLRASPTATWGALWTDDEGDER